MSSHRYYDKPWERTNNRKVASDISNSYQYGEGELELTVYKKVNPPYTNM